MTSTTPKTKTNWPPEQRQIVRDVYPSGGARAVRERLPDKTNHAVWSMAKELNVRVSPALKQAATIARKEAKAKARKKKPPRVRIRPTVEFVGPPKPAWDKYDDWPIKRRYLPVGAWRADPVAHRSVFDLAQLEPA